MNQCEKLLDYMKSHGSVTGMESIDMGVMNYKGRINGCATARITRCWKTCISLRGNSSTHGAARDGP